MGTNITYFISRFLFDLLLGCGETEEQVPEFPLFELALATVSVVDFLSEQVTEVVVVELNEHVGTLRVPESPQNPLRLNSSLVGRRRAVLSSLALVRLCFHLSYSFSSTPILSCICFLLPSETSFTLVNLGWFTTIITSPFCYFFCCSFPISGSI